MTQTKVCKQRLKRRTPKQQSGALGRPRKFSEMEIRAIAASPKSRRQLAKELKVSEALISGIKSGKLYSELTGINYDVARSRPFCLRKLTDEQIIEIKATKGILSGKEAASHYGVSVGLISHIRTGRVHAGVT